MSNSKNRAGLARAGAVPMYRQLAEAIRTQIVAGAFGSEGAIPTERELMVRYDLSRVTVRLAMDELANQGLIVRHRGKGTFVAPQRVRHDLSVLSGFYDALTAQGVEPTATLGAYRVVAPAAAGDVALPYETNVYVERTYMIDGEPIATVQAALHPRAAAIDRSLAERHPNYAILTTLLSFVIERADVAIRAAMPSAETAAALRIAAGEPVLILDRTSYTPEGVMVEKSRFAIRADRYEFALALRGGHAVSQALRPRRSRVPGSAPRRTKRRTRT